VSSLVRSLERACELAKAGAIDAVMLVRGGGDPSGLRSVSDEAAARAILAISVPVITGIGHARDRTLLDEITWCAADTPSKALGVVKDIFAKPAKTAMAAWAAIRRDIDRAIRLEAGPELERRYERVAQAIRPMLQAERAALEGFRSVAEVRRAETLVELRQLRRDLDLCAESLAWEAAVRPHGERDVLGGLYEGLLHDARNRVDGLDDLGSRSEDVSSHLKRLLERQEAELLALYERAGEGALQSILLATGQLGALETAVQALDADALMARGYTLAVRPDGKLVRSAAQAAALATLSLLFADGELAVVPAKPATKASVH
jgi:exodeoxyribonuclease VII large subunit